MTRKKNILITGCSTGIGLCCALGLQQKGYQIYATVRNEEDRERLLSQGLDQVLIMELCDSQSIDNALAKVFEHSDGRLDILFNNAAYGQIGALEDLSTDALREQFESNFFAWHDLTNKIIPIMRKQGEGKIIQNSSVLGLIALPMRGAYTASKFAVEGWSDTLRLELHGSGIQVININPGPITTQFRNNTYRFFKKNIDTQNSVHHQTYKKINSTI